MGETRIWQDQGVARYTQESPLRWWKSLIHPCILQVFTKHRYRPDAVQGLENKAVKKIESLLSRGLNTDEELRAARSHLNNVIDMEEETQALESGLLTQLGST